MDALIRLSIVDDFNIEDIIAFNGSITKVKATGEVDIGLEYVDWRRKSLVIPNNITIIGEELEALTTPAPVDLNSIQREAMGLHHLAFTHWTHVGLATLLIIIVLMTILWLYTICKERKRYSTPLKTSYSRRGSFESVQTDSGLTYRGKKRGSVDYVAEDDESIEVTQPPQPRSNLNQYLPGMVGRSSTASGKHPALP